MAGDILCGELQSTWASMATLKLAAAPPAAPPSRFTAAILFRKLLRICS